MTLRGLGAVLAVVLGCGLAAGCAGSFSEADKAGGMRSAPALLRLAITASDAGDVPAVAAFAQRVEVLSGGELRIQIVGPWREFAPDAEAQVVRAVGSGTVDLGSVGSRVFDTVGVRSFQALSAPMLIDGYALERAVLTSGIPARMLAQVDGLRVTGLSVLGDGLRIPIGAHRALLGPGGWRGIGFGTYPGGVQEQAIRALGATPVEVFGPYRTRALETGAIEGFDFDLRRYARNPLLPAARYAAANVVLWPQFDVLIANPDRLAALTDRQRGWLRTAAAEAAARSVALARSGDVAGIGVVCARGARFSTATPAQLAALRRAFAPLYRTLGREPLTASYLAQIERLKRAVPPGPAPSLPRGCSVGSRH
jgi:TRAP-type transport system periplasmic protein